MKILVLYNQDTGNIIFTQTNATSAYAYLVEDIPNDRIPVSVDVENNICILGDTPEVAEQKRKLQEELDKKQAEINKKQEELLQKQAELVEITYKTLLGGTT